MTIPKYDSHRMSILSQIFSVMQIVDHIGPKPKSQNLWCYKNSLPEQHKNPDGKKSTMITLSQKATGEIELETSHWLVRRTQVCFILCIHMYLLFPNTATLNVIRLLFNPGLKCLLMISLSSVDDCFVLVE